MRKNTAQAKLWLNMCYPVSDSSRQMVEKWFADFKGGRTNIDDAKRSGHPNSEIVPENIKKFAKWF